MVYTDNFSDEHGNIVPASHYDFPGEWPDELVVTVTSEDFAGRTKMTLRHAGIPSGEMSDMTETGWSESFDKLEKVLIASETVFTVNRAEQEIVMQRVFDAPR